jgi:hypothetical protein
MEKKCFKCGIIKPLDEYYKHKKMLDGHLNKCKECAKTDANSHRVNNLEKVKEYDRIRGLTEKRKQKTKDYQNKLKINDPDKWRAMRNKACRKYKEKHREKYIANSRVRYAISTGKIIKKSCSICGDSYSEAHHPDYKKPLEVVWLCDKHHKKVHKEIRSKERSND